MRFPKIFTDSDKTSAIKMQRRNPQMTDEQIISAIVAQIHAEIERGKNVPLIEKFAQMPRLKRKLKRTNPQRVFLQRLPGSFESAQR